MEHHEAYNGYPESQFRVLSEGKELEYLTSLFASLPNLKEIELLSNAEDDLFEY